MEATLSAAVGPSFARLTGRRRPPSDRPPLPSTLPPPPALPSTLPPPPPPAPPPPSLAVPATVAVMLARLYPKIRKTVATLHPGVATDDVTQEAAIRALEIWDRFTPPEGEDDERRARRAWVAKVALFVALEWRTKTRTREREMATDPAEIDATVRGTALSAEAILLGTEQLQELQNATSPERWHAFWAHHVEGIPASMIASEMGAPMNTVYTWIRLAAKDLRAYLARREAAERGPKPRK